MEFLYKPRKQENKAMFEITGITPVFANVLRRYMMSRIPTMAIDTVTIYENNFTMFDEYIAHRVGLVPIKSKVKLGGDEETIFTLDVMGPKKVYSSDLISDDKNFIVARDKILLFELNEGQSLRLEAKANINTGKKHARYASSIVSYEINEKKKKINFKIETYYQHKPFDTIKLSVLEILNDCENLKDEVKKAGMAESGQMR